MPPGLRWSGAWKPAIRPSGPICWICTPIRWSMPWPPTTAARHGPQPKTELRPEHGAHLQWMGEGVVIGVGSQPQGLQARVGWFYPGSEQGVVVMVAGGLQNEGVRPGLVMAAGTVRGNHTFHPQVFRSQPIQGHFHT